MAAAASQDLAVIWRQVPKVASRGHWGHRLAFGPDGKLWITSSERQQFTPAQDMKSNLGKIVRLNDDGSVPADNPFYAQGGVTAQIWSLGHRNLLGIAFAPDGRLYAHEMGPRGGDELNIIEKGANYGYPIVSNGDHYDGRDIPDHPTRPEFQAPLVTWNPVISPAGFIIYSGKMFPDWTGNGFIGGLSSESLVRVEFGNGTRARSAALRHGPAHPRSGARPGRRHLAARRPAQPHRRPPPQAHPVNGDIPDLLAKGDAPHPLNGSTSGASSCSTSFSMGCSS